ncbi:MAG: signal recognition particle-docking protein FtsY [Candidatus ainarchaeum sp.]|nr:signal recognition particle-docking protein FtsY [Candidatus ainarchaeum sp.]
MFDFFKKKISGLVDKFSMKIGGAKEEQVAGAKEGQKTAPREDIGAPEPKPIKNEERDFAEKKAEATEVEKAPQVEGETRKEHAPEKQPSATEVKGENAEERPGTAKPTITVLPPIQKKHEEKEDKKQPKAETERQIRKPEAKPEEKKTGQKEEKKPEAKKEEKKAAGKVKLGLADQVKSIFSNEVELRERDVQDALSDFEIELLEADVAYGVAEQIKEELRKELVGRKMKRSNLQQQISEVFFKSIWDIMAENKGEPIEARLKRDGARPITIMFTGPNGSGKTTTIAKIANMLKNQGYGVVIAAADTFRAAAIEQMEIHGQKLGIKVIKGKYGADPTSVAYDAVNHAKAHGLDVVLIDTAGRQETNQNLLNELKKMARIINPEIKLYVGESLAGNAVIEQVEAFNAELKLDGIVLTKLDCDAKGGTVISISKVTKVPVIYVTMGQGYEDIEVFDAEKMAKGIAG